LRNETEQRKSVRFNPFKNQPFSNAAARGGMALDREASRKKSEGESEEYVSRI